MNYVKLGNSDLIVSEVCLGCMTFGDPTNWMHEWLLEEEKSIEIIKYALDKGINFFDTANVYSYGESERILGKAIKKYANRADVVIATKLGIPMNDREFSGGLSREEILYQVEQSLKRLDTQYIDLYIIHRFDYKTPVEETMKTLHELVISGKVKYIGASSMYAWQFSKMQYIAEINGWTKFISMQNHMNLIYREEEREMQGLCIDQNVSMTPFSPLAAGKLARTINIETKRSQTDKSAKQKYSQNSDIDQQIISRVEELSIKHNVTMSVISLAWLYSKQNVTSLVVGASKTAYIDDAVNATTFKLTDDEINYLEELYIPKTLVGPK